MAIAFSAGGYTRSDFMISDAAMPIRLEEELEQLEQTARFSEVLSGIGGAKKSAPEPVKEASADSTAVKETPAADVPAALSSAQIRKLAREIVSGKKKLEDVPKDQITVELLLEIAKLMAAPPVEEEEEEDKLFRIHDEDETEVNVTVSGQLAAVLALQQSAVPDELTEELGELLAAVKAAAEIESVPAVQDTAPEMEFVPAAEESAQPVIPEEAPEQAAPAVIPQEADEPAENAAASELVMTVKAESEPISDELPKSVRLYTEQPAETIAQTTEAVTAPQNAEMKQQAENGGQQSELPFGQSGSTSAMTEGVDSTAFEELRTAEPRMEVREVRAEQRGEVTESEAQTEDIPEAAEQRPQMFRSERVVSKSDELQMIRSSSKPAESEQPVPTVIQTDMADRPVILTRANGETVTVRPSEVLEQAAAKLIEMAQEMTETEIRYSITLEPADFGKITVRMTKAADGAVSVSIAAENAHTQRILEENGAVLQANLKNSGIRLESWQTVNESQQDAHAEDYRGSSKNPYFAEEGENSEDADDSSFAELIASM